MPQALQGKGKESISSRMHLDRALAAQLSLNLCPFAHKRNKESFDNKGN